jgi:hypothetical protein
LLLRQFAATPKTRKKHPENDSGAGCPIGYKAQNPLKSRTFRKKIKADFSIKICCLFWRRRRDSNSRAGFPTYTLSRGASSANLSTSPNFLVYSIYVMAEEVGFEPTWAFTLTVFKTAPL